MKRDERHLSNLVLLLILVVVALYLVKTESEPDIFGRIAYARDAFARGDFTWHTDPYSYTVPGGRWVDHEWGFSWVAFLTYQLGGWEAIRVLRVALMAATAWVCLDTTRRMPDAARIRPLMGFMLAAPLALAFIGPRAQAFGYLLFAWMVWCFARSWNGSLRWVLWGVAPMPLWVNLHGGFIAGMGVVALWCALRLFTVVQSRDRKGLALLALALAWCGVSALLQPWGWNYALVVAQAGTMVRPFVDEWSPPKFLGPHWISAVMLTAAGVAAALAKPRRWPNLAVIAVLAVETFLHRRHLMFLAIAVAVFGFPALVSLWNSWRPLRRAGHFRILVRLATVVVGIATLFLLGVVGGTVRTPAPHEPDWPTSALEFLRTQGSGGLLVDFNWAQYVIFEASPQFKVAIDGRYEEVYPDDVMQRYVAWHYGLDGWQSLPADPATRFALVMTNSAQAKRLDALAPQWRRIYSDSTATAFAKAPDVGPTR